MIAMIGIKEKKIFSISTFDAGLKTEFLIIKGQWNVISLRAVREDGIDVQIVGKANLRKLAKAILAEVEK